MSFSRRSFLASAALLPIGNRAADAADVAPAPRKFRLGLVTYNLAAAWDLPTILKVCKTHGISPVELRTTHRHQVEPTLDQEMRKEVKKRFADAGVEFWGCGTVCEFQSPDAAVVRKNIETCKQFVQLAADLGGRGVKVRPNGLPRGIPVAKTLEQIGKALIECGRAAADANIEIWVEVHGGGTQLPANMKTIMDACGHPAVGLTWNSNPTDVQEGSLATAFKMLRPWIRSCHINELYRDAAGTYPYRELFRLFRETGYDRVTMIEVARAQPDLPSAEELLRYYKALWEELTK
jgi:sugar phosphate isomerase/epimerase